MISPAFICENDGEVSFSSSSKRKYWALANQSTTSSTSPAPNPTADSSTRSGPTSSALP